jgi:Multicopper oxidase
MAPLRLVRLAARLRLRPLRLRRAVLLLAIVPPVQWPAPPAAVPDSGPPLAPPAVPELAVHLEDYRVTLLADTVSPGTLRLAVRNASQRAHNLRLQSPEAEARTTDLLPGERATLELTLPRPGAYALVCDVAYHQQKGMVAVLTVAPEEAPPPGGG